MKTKQEVAYALADYAIHVIAVDALMSTRFMRHADKLRNLSKIVDHETAYAAYGAINVIQANINAYAINAATAATFQAARVAYAASAFNIYNAANATRSVANHAISAIYNTANTSYNINATSIAQTHIKYMRELIRIASI